MKVNVGTAEYIYKFDNVESVHIQGHVLSLFVTNGEGSLFNMNDIVMFEVIDNE